MTVATTTAWGNAKPLDAVLQRIADNTDATVLELAIGALPVDDPLHVLEQWSHRFTYVGHHAMPVGQNKMIRPAVGNEREVVDACHRYNIRSYSAHPPAKLDRIDTWDWAWNYHEALAAIDCHFAVETMFPDDRDRRWLAYASDIDTFLSWALAEGWAQPLCVDVSHLNIGVHSGAWSVSDVVDLLNADVAHEIHVSSNDGRRDQHRPLDPNSREAGWAALVQEHPFLVDEGRRRTAVTAQR